MNIKSGKQLEDATSLVPCQSARKAGKCAPAPVLTLTWEIWQDEAPRRNLH